MNRRVWLAALCLYAIASAADMAAHLHAGRDWPAPGQLAVAFSAGLFWPIDLLAQPLLAL